MHGEDYYAALGLRPGASRAQIDDAYRRLIKRHHPDRSGGDCGRAAEINRAYTQLRRSLAAPAPRGRQMPVAVQPPRRRPAHRNAWTLVALVAIIAAAILADSRRTHDPRRASAPFSWPASNEASAAIAYPLADFDEPLHTRLIDRSIADAMQFYDAGDSAATLQFSRSCHIRFRESPSLAWFDACTAFDEAIAALNSDNALARSGPFSPPAMVARHMASARVLARDMLAADSRVHKIRSRVELAVLPGMDPAAGARLEG